MVEVPQPRIADDRARDGTNGYFVVDRAYLREQAAEAVTTFLAPLAGVVAAARNKRPRNGHEIREKSKAA